MTPLQEANEVLALTCDDCDQPIHVGSVFLGANGEPKTHHICPPKPPPRPDPKADYYRRWLTRLSNAGKTGLHQTNRLQDESTIPIGTAAKLTRRRFAYKGADKRVRLTATGRLRLQQLTEGDDL